ncbi:SprT-like domain-containing protein [Pseudogracilibacillus sp. SE30717A]|uniref:SprT-like domain-containing protein n=1 Tax=Pseudogracilibacillus sp. SE30717A TaxID=3098293 RepID=UPI00300E2E28
MSEEELKKIASEFLSKNYNIELNVPVLRNNRLRTTLGRFVISSDKKTPLRIEIAGNTLDYGTDKAIIGVLKHECIHYALHLKGESSTDGHPYFESELKKHDAPSTRSTRIGKNYVFTCNACGKENETRIKQLNRTPYRYRTTCCNAKLTIIGERIYDGTN